MDPQRWIRIESLYHAALKKRPAERVGYLAEACEGEPHLKREVESLLACADMELNSPLARGDRWPSGFRLGSYEIIEALGAGGMGEVYRARDLKLKREIAIKTLPEEFTQDSDRVSRFQREAEVLASLNHPNIANIYHLEEQNGSRYLVLELVEGETLAKHISRGPIPLDEAVPIAKQIVDALEAAHDRGIIHRDLKPGNIKRTPEGRVKVLDFGLAKAAQSHLASEPGFSNSPTLVSGSIGGVILGTAPYMSPEQARGKLVDARTDIWAFGCVLYEMLTGQQAFAGETTTDVLAKVLEAQPKWDALPAETPSSIRFLLETALNKDPKQRLHHIADVRPLLSRPATIDKSPISTVEARGSRRGRLITAALATVLIASLVPTTLYVLRAPEEKTAIRLEMAVPGVQTGEFPAISPNGQYVAYRAQADGKSAIWIRPISEDQARPLAGTENGTNPFWSPDSRYIAFIVDGKLKKISIAGGAPPTTIVETPIAPAPGTWNRDGVILFTSIPPVGSQPGLARVSASGGAVTRLGTTHRDGFDDVLPQFLPDGRHFLYISATGPVGTVDLYAGSLDGGPPVHIMSYSSVNLLANDFAGQYAAPGYLLFGRGGILMAQPFDEKRLALTGEPVAIAEHVRAFSVSGQQTIVYRPIQGTAAGTQQVVSTDRRGTRGPSVTMPGTFGSLRLSRDGHRLALDQRDKEGNTDLWGIDLDRGVSDRLTTDPAVDEYPRFSPDGKQVVFTSGRMGLPRMFIRPSVAIGTDQPLRLSPGDLEEFAEDWSPPDGKYIVFVQRPISGQYSDIWVKPMFGDGKAFPFVRSKSFVQAQPRLSSDSHWLAYTTNQTGTYQIVVKAFPDPNGDQTTVTGSGGIYPTWRGDGRELYYLALDGKIMAVPVKEDGGKIIFGAPTALFQAPLTVPSVPTAHQYDVNPEGTRFFFIADANTKPATPNDSGKLSVILNWTAALHKK